MYPQHNYSAANVTERTKILGSGARGQGGGTWLPRIRNKQWNMHDNNKKHFSNTILLKQNYWDQQCLSCLSCYQYSVLTRNLVWLLSCQTSHAQIHVISILVSIIVCYQLVFLLLVVVFFCFLFFFGGGVACMCVCFVLFEKQTNKFGGWGKLHVFTINTWKTEHFCFLKKTFLSLTIFSNIRGALRGCGGEWRLMGLYFQVVTQTRGPLTS